MLEDVRGPKRGQFAVYATIVAATLILGLVMAELYVRLFSRYGYWTPRTIAETGRSVDLMYEPTVFARHALVRRQVLLYGEDSPKRGQVNWRINSRGYRAPELSVPKPSGTVRIVFYGGSQVFDLNTHGDDGWPGEVGKRLRDGGMENVETINAGIPGHASHDSFGRLFSEGHRWGADCVVLCNAWNDIKDFRFEEDLLRLRKPLRNENSPFTHYANPADRFLCERSQLFVRLRRRALVWKYSTGTEGVVPTDEPITDTIGSAGPEQYRMNVEMFVDCARRCGATPVLMTQPRLVSLSNTEADRARIMYEYVGLTHDALCRAFALTDSVVREVASREDVPFIDAASWFTGRAEFFTDHVHLNPSGSRELALGVTRELQKILRR